ncbi:uncharacterized protein LOC105166414 [Sesamum indicum]|uniref:Uncharacterized protein LOC105166414 n=1 Tax=Sesamum indicum TaxID=4182 RepID=A0A6I9TLG9_SESIN|nr:uncharacterized protein LOC105166414 [Sesamum indicum]
MRSWLLMFLLLLSSLLVHEAQGIRLLKGSVADRQHNIQEFLPGKRNNYEGVDEEAVIMCKSKHCSGRIRKLTMTLISSTPTIAKNDKNEENKEENLSVNPSSTNQQAGQPTPDILNIAGMDYSLARRKPPIHN